MEDILQITYEGGRRFTSVFAETNTVIPSDQLPSSGGNGTAPEPFQLFLAALASCAAVYIQGYCDKRGIDWSGISLRMKGDWNDTRRLYDSIHFEVSSASGLPDATMALIEMAIRRSAVFRQVEHATTFETVFTHPPAMSDEE